jgi:type VI secretion system secreted protein VgrG
MSPPEEAPEDTGDVSCTFECDASSAEWKVVEATITEELNEPYHLFVSLRTDAVDADPTEMLGESCTVIIESDDLTNQYPAIVQRIEDMSTGGRFVDVRVEASAALWMLSQNRQTRIFQDVTVPEILDQVLGDGLSEYDRKHDSDFSRDYPKCEYRVQYDESDLEFCERLIEEEGIVYWFDRSDSAEALFLTDDPVASVDVESTDGKEIAFSTQTGARESVQSFSRLSSMRPTKVAMRHYNWTQPSVAVEEEKEGEASGDAVDGSAIGPLRETYQHDLLPPTYSDYSDSDGFQKEDAKDQCQMRRELDARDKLHMRGHSSVVGFCAGGGFDLLEHDLEGGYVLTRVTHSFAFDGTAVSYGNNFSCIPADTPYRPDRRTPKPRVASIETATVVGPDGQEIHTDKHGRIKVQFHWDREGGNDDHSSCFIRVVQPWAGAGWGFVFIPRIGMEVTVAFVHGDPDRPIVTGTVYNGENLTSYPMPDEMTKSTIRTQSSPGGDGYNELTFEDKAGEEEVFLQAQKNLRELVKNDHSTEIGNDQKLDVGNDQTTTIGHDQTLDVGNDQTTTIGENQSLDVGSNQTIKVGGDQSESVSGNLDQSVSKDLSQNVGGEMTEDIGKSRKCNVGDDWTSEAGGKVEVRSGADTNILADKKIGLAAEGAMQLATEKDFTLSAKKKGNIKIEDELTIKVGQASITLKKNGDITIKGGKINIKGQSDVIIKGSKTAIN